MSNTMESRRRPRHIDRITTWPRSHSLNHDGAADDEPSHVPEESNHLIHRRIERGRHAYLVALQSWADEYKSAIICGLSIVILVIILWYYDGKLAPRLSPVGALDLDMVVIALVTVARVGVGNVVEACIAQGAWIWVAKTHQRRTNTVARLEDFKLFDEASRGFLGSAALIWRMKGLHLSCIGAAIILFTHGFETFSQQMVDYVPKPVVFKNETERWPIFPSLAVCGECTPKTVLIECSDEICVYNVSSNTSIKVLRGDDNEAFKVRPITERPLPREQGTTAYLSIFELVGASEHKSKTNSKGFECALWVCMKAYDTSMNDGHLSQRIISVWNETQLEKKTNAHLDEHVFINVPNEMNTLEHSRYTISARAVETIRRFMDNLTNGWYQDNGGRVNFSSDWIEAIHDGLPAMSEWMDQLTLSLSNEFRRHGKLRDSFSTSYEGSATKLANFVKVKWLWMLYPPLCLIVSLYYLFATISASVRDDVAIWKGDSMPMLFSCIHPDILHLGSGMIDTHKGLDELGRHGIALAKSESGAWVFEPTVEPDDHRGRLRRVFRWRD
ncbi:hypothetical protein NHJ13051_006607 [Beauveria bassiana]